VTLIAPVLALAARHGRFLLVLGLIAGILLPNLAVAMRPWLQELVGGLLFLAALRIGPRKALGAVADVPVTILLVLLFQLILPLLAVFLFWIAGMLGSPLATALVLMLSASSISGSPNLTIMTGHDPAPALRMLVMGTALLPLIVIPVFWLLPELGGVTLVLTASARLLTVIVATTLAAFALRHFMMPEPDTATLAALDGLSAIAMAVVVVGLMSAAGPALVNAPGKFALWLAAACGANFGLQIVSSLVISRTRIAVDFVPFSIIAGNRNIALFLIGLPPEITDPLLLFIGCYQIPMYLTPIILQQLYRQT